MSRATVIGGGLAGCEAAWALARAGVDVTLYEMRPESSTGAHKTGDLAELVCSNSLRGRKPTQAPGLLKLEMMELDSLVMRCARLAEVPAGDAFAVDREAFSAAMTAAIVAHPRIHLERRRLDAIPAEGPVIVATGPLTHPALHAAIEALVGRRSLAFYDAIAPIVTRDSIDWNYAYLKDRWHDDVTDAVYVNCPLNREQYEAFVDRLLAGPFVAPKAFEADMRHFEGCLPIEEMAARGRETLRFGPLKPVGLRHPHTGQLFYAVVQLRPDNRAKSLLNMVGFQTKLTYAAQKEAFRLIPALHNATFVRLGSMHRNTFLDSPRLLDPDLKLRKEPRIRFAGQITGVEGYIESAASGIIAGLALAHDLAGRPFVVPPATTAIGALMRYISDPVVEPFQPTNIHFGLLDELEPPEHGRPLKGQAKKEARAARALAALATWKAEQALELEPAA